MHAYLVHVYIYAHINMQLYLTYWTLSLILRMVSPSKHVTGKEKKKYCETYRCEKKRHTVGRHKNSLFSHTEDKNGEVFPSVSGSQQIFC